MNVNYAAMLTAVMACQLLFAQGVAPNPPTPPRAPRPTTVYGSVTPSPAYSFFASRSGSDECSKALRQVDAWRKKLQASEEADERDKVISELEKALDAYFEADLKNRVAELERLNKRTDKTKKQLARRAAEKSSILELQMKKYRYEADGLGLLDSDTSSQQRLSGFYRSASPIAVASVSGTLVNVKSDIAKVKQRIQKLRQQLRMADDDDDDAEILTALEKELGEYFDLDLKARQAELERVRKKLEKMDTQLAKRKRAKDEIVELALKTVINDADGLGLFSVPTTRTRTSIAPLAR